MLRFSGLYQENCSDLYVTCQVFAEGKPLALPVRTSYKAFSTRWKCVFIATYNLVCNEVIQKCSYFLVSEGSFHWPCLLSLLLAASVQLEWVAAATRQVPRPSPKCPGGSHSVGHLWARQSRSCWGNHRHPVWQIWVRFLCTWQTLSFLIYVKYEILMQLTQQAAVIQTRHYIYRMIYTDKINMHIKRTTWEQGWEYYYYYYLEFSRLMARG